ncbi:MAG TPA: RNA polymerase sigma-70 factor [Chitinophagaceae bacterium]|jgi:RNA polymerase sigma-70 factor (ECF subfamily)|nr:RNA polymerase sigma-70 factor [Chitinophagaceae bacterium]
MDKTQAHNNLYLISQENDQQAFKELYGFYFFRLLRFCISIVHAKEPAEEIVNDVFMNLWRRRSFLHKIENLDVYLYVAVKNQSLDHLSRNHLKEMVDISAVSSEYISFTLDPEQLLISAERASEIEHAVNQLPARCKLIFKMIKEDGLKYKEVASILNLSIKTVEAQLTIAMKKLTTAILFASDGKAKQKNTGIR